MEKYRAVWPDPDDRFSGNYERPYQQPIKGHSVEEILAMGRRSLPRHVDDYLRETCVPPRQAPAPQPTMNPVPLFLVFSAVGYLLGWLTFS